MQGMCNFFLFKSSCHSPPERGGSLLDWDKKSLPKKQILRKTLSLFWGFLICYFGELTYSEIKQLFLYYTPPAYFCQFVHSPNFWIIFWYSYNNIHKILHLLIRISCIFITYYLLNLYTVWNAYLTDTFHSLSYI